MQFGREPLAPTSRAMSTDGERGWACGENPGHFELDSGHPRPVAAATTVPDARWDDDGGARR